MELRRLLLTVLISFAIWQAYQAIVRQIDMVQHGRTTEAEIIEHEPGPDFTYLRLRYTIGGVTYIKGVRAPGHDVVKNRNILTIHYLPSRPDEPHLSIDPQKTNKLIYYALVAAFVYGIYRFTCLMITTTQPPN